MTTRSFIPLRERPRASLLAARVAARFAPLLLCLAGCLGAENGQVNGESSAGLSLTLTPPPGVSVQVVLTGPQSFKKTIAVDGVTTANLVGLTPGVYVFAAPVVIVPTSLVDTVWSVDLSALTDDAVTLTAGKTLSFALTYAVRAGSGSLFLTRFGDARMLGGWPATSLLQGTNPPATEQLLTSYQLWSGLALDPDGGVWMLANDAGTSSLLYFTADQLSAAQPTPKLLQPGGRLDAFCLDGSGGIWGASTADRKLSYWTAATIASGNLLTPDVILQGAAGSLDTPSALALDATGSLWVVNAAVGTAPGSLARIIPRQLGASGYVLPTVQLPLAAPSAMAFDAMGNLWVISAGNTLLEFAVAQLGGQSVSPAVTIPLDADATATSIAFDALGDLWLALTHSTDDSNALVVLTPGDLAVSGTPAAVVALQTPAQQGAPSLLLIDPTPAGLPLAGVPK